MGLARLDRHTDDLVAGLALGAGEIVGIVIIGHDSIFTLELMFLL
jgi:hypothetical protein